MQLTLRIFKPLLYVSLLSSGIVFAAEQVNFAMHWPQSGCVSIQETTHKRGNVSETSYTICWHPSKHTTDEITIEYHDFKFTSLNDKPAPKEYADLAFNLPNFYVNKKGEFLRVDKDDLIKGFDMLAKIHPESKDQIEETKAEAAENTGFFQIFEQATAKTWNSWVGTWVGTFEIGEHHDAKEKADLIIKAQKAPYYSIDFTQEQKPEEVTAFINNLVARTNTKLDKPFKVQSANIKAGTVTTKDLQPKSAYWLQEIKFYDEKNKLQTDLESHRYIFGSFVAS